ncbi:MAG: adenylate/guanylate cyclase domain-containing protein [Magnetococcales bacterium]|nr:adenylate/guanylate cyclase domain-containing protein [Magnetococcales bacterium]
MNYYKSIPTIVATLFNIIPEDVDKNSLEALLGALRSTFEPLHLHGFLVRLNRNSVSGIDDIYCVEINDKIIVKKKVMDTLISFQAVSFKHADDFELYWNDEGYSADCERVATATPVIHHELYFKFKNGDGGVLFVEKAAQSKKLKDDQFYKTSIMLITKTIRDYLEKYNNYSRYVIYMFWKNAQASSSGGSSDARFPPWQGSKGENEISTVTLSLDFRKSTFAMEKAVDPKRYSSWSAAMTVVMKELVHQYFGVFDKFTGDGVIAHFLDQDVKAVYKYVREEKLALSNIHDWDEDTACAITAAVDCARDMVFAAHVLVGHLRCNLRYFSKKFGADVGIATDHANWHVDDAGSIIVVGPGVVDACRISSAEDPDQIFMTMNAFCEYKKLFPKASGLGELKDFKSKDYPENYQLQIYKLNGETGRHSDVRKLCEDALREVDYEIIDQSE